MPPGFDRATTAMAQEDRAQICAEELEDLRALGEAVLRWAQRNPGFAFPADLQDVLRDLPSFGEFAQCASALDRDARRAAEWEILVLLRETLLDWEGMPLRDDGRSRGSLARLHDALDRAAWWIP